MSVLDAGGLARGARERGVKRAFDFIVASLILLLVAPLLVVIGLVVKLDSPGPVLFRQRRVGKNCKFFDVLKFRTLTHGAEEHGHELIEGMPIASAVQELKSRSVEKHVTRTGGLLRSTSLDELPQLWNVIRGEMSLVGPRPLREYEVDSLDEWQVATRQTVLPGITGLWQVSGRSSVSWDERVHLDCAYARHWSLTSDLRILARTVAVVLRRSDTV
jgi:lipopolysaccharide/colanic/teichoic acid biosynthesis glycosyltransferase